MEPTVHYIVSQGDVDRLIERVRQEILRLAILQPAPLVKIKTAATQLGMSEKTIHRRVKSRQWPSYRDPDGVTVLVDVQEIRALLRVEIASPDTTHIGGARC